MPRSSSEGAIRPGDPIDVGDEVVFPDPILWTNLGRWALSTLRSDLRHHRRHPHPLSVPRVWHTLFPSLAQPLFLVGAPRSGTSFLGECLGALPEISYHFEPVATKAATRYIYDGLWPAWKARIFYRGVYRWLMRIHAEGHLRFAEKTPRNCFAISFLADTFPEAQFIHLIRDGRDAACSYRKQPWLQAVAAKSGQREPGGYPHGPYPRFWVEPERLTEFQTTSDLHRCIWAWRRHVEAARSALGRLGSDMYMEIRYEQLVSEPEAVGERLLAFLNVGQPSSQRVFLEAIGRVTGSSVGQWRRELTPPDLEMIETEAGPLLRILGYV